ncbi:hypothetical protein GW17_00045356 [Ensete ventricosum]|nr:hypothetical protein GW17_00045356 [Ensete ventricosum]RZR78604.1 hypothetical protein BHM03_00004021 [Ensete ventricosum]
MRMEEVWRVRLEGRQGAGKGGEKGRRWGWDQRRGRDQHTPNTHTDRGGVGRGIGSTNTELLLPPRSHPFRFPFVVAFTLAFISPSQHTHTVAGTRTARYRVVPPKIDHWRSISAVGGRLREKSTVNGRLREKKGKRRRGKEEKKKRGVPISPRHPRRRAVVARGSPVPCAADAACDPRGEKGRGDKVCLPTSWRSNLDGEVGRGIVVNKAEKEEFPIFLGLDQSVRLSIYGWEETSRVNTPPSPEVIPLSSTKVLIADRYRRSLKSSFGHLDCSLAVFTKDW